MTREAALRWTVLVDGPQPGAVNMARDVALARAVSDAVEETPGAGRTTSGEQSGRAGGDDSLAAFLRFYAWSRPTLSFGRNEPARERFDPETLEAAGVDVVRRPTGGRAVLHDREVTYSIAVPASALGGPRETYRLVNDALAAALATLGANVSLAGDADALTPDAGPCFDRPAAGEVVARGRKLVGSAQARTGKALLQHGSILLHDDQVRIPELLREGVEIPGAGPAGRPVALVELVDTVPEPSRVAMVVAREMARALPGRWPPGGRPSAEGGWGPYARAVGIEPEFRSPTWTWRR